VDKESEKVIGTMLSDSLGYLVIGSIRDLGSIDSDASQPMVSAARGSSEWRANVPSILVPLRMHAGSAERSEEHGVALARIEQPSDTQPSLH
jgi:hypothetical protein